MWIVIAKRDSWNIKTIWQNRLIKKEILIKQYILLLRFLSVLHDKGVVISFIFRGHMLHAMSCVGHMTLRLYINPLRKLRSLIILLLLLQLHYTTTRSTSLMLTYASAREHVTWPNMPRNITKAI